VHLVGFIIRIYHYVRSPEHQILSQTAFPLSCHLSNMRINSARRKTRPAHN